MAHMVGLFVPDDMSKWPAIDPSDPTYQRDLASLQVRGGVNEMEGMHHGGDHAEHHGNHAERGGSEGGEMEMDDSSHADHASDADHQATR
jgi:hypothetical protein